AASESFPPHERARVMGIVNAAPNVANIIGPPLMIWLATTWGWQACFVIVGAIGFVWLPFWVIADRRDLVEKAKTQRGVPLRAILRYREAWAYGWAKFLTDPVWWFYLFWLPTYLTDVRHLSASERGVALMIIYSISAIGSAAGGWIADWLVNHRQWPVGRSRK